MRHLLAVTLAVAVVLAVAMVVGSGPRAGATPAHGGTQVPPGEVTLVQGRREFVRLNRPMFAVRWPACARPGTYVMAGGGGWITTFVDPAGGFVLLESNQRRPSLTAATTHGHPRIRPPVTYGGIMWHIYAYRSNLVIVHVFPKNVTVVIEAPGSSAEGLRAAAAFSHVGVCV